MNDTIYVHVSHMPQLLAYGAKEVIGLGENTAPFLRISQSDTKLWCDIFALNSDVLVAALDRYLDAISHIRRELQSPPADTKTQASAAETPMLFARIAASCLITTVMEAEKKAGLPFSRFAGTGFADFVSPATSEPDMDLEHISNHYAALLPMLAAYEAQLQLLIAPYR
jgi:prephenate dehydrogenase